MRIPTWRLALTGGAITILAVAGIGLAAAATSAPSELPLAPLAPAATTTRSTAEDTAALAAAFEDQLNATGARDAGRVARLLRAGRHLVHAEMTVTDREGALVNLQLDHGTVQSIGGGSLVIAEAGGGTEPISTSDATIVYVGRAAGDLGDVTVGAEVFVQSRIVDGHAVAKRILVIPVAAT